MAYRVAFIVEWLLFFSLLYYGGRHHHVWAMWAAFAIAGFMLVHIGYERKRNI